MVFSLLFAHPERRKTIPASPALELGEARPPASPSILMHSIPPSLTGSHLRTYETIFQHPLSHNLEWRAVRSLFEKLGSVTEEPNGNLKVTRHGQVLVLHPPRTKDVADADEIMTLRHFLERSAAVPDAADGGEAHWLLVIDHHEARIFQPGVRGTLAELILPHPPEDYFRHAPHSRDFSRGQEKPDPNSFFEPVVKALAGGGPILIFGRGTGTGSEMDQFIVWTKRHHPEFAERIIGSLSVDEKHLSDGELLAKARDYYATAAAAN
jgi:hypothetical protein